MARNLEAELRDRPFGGVHPSMTKGSSPGWGPSGGVADIARVTIGGRLAHLLEDAIEWEYREPVKHLRGWDPVSL